MLSEGMGRRRRITVLTVVFCCCLAFLGVQALMNDSAGSVRATEGETYPGNTLISVQGYGERSPGESGRLIEVTPEGEVVWEFAPPNSRVFEADVLDNGNVLVAVGTRVPAAECPDEHLQREDDHCIRNRAIELDGDSLESQPQIVWEYDWVDEQMFAHEVHDVVRLDDGRTAIMDMGNDRAIIVDRRGEITWEWRAEEYLTAGTPFYKEYGGPEPPEDGVDWTHANDIEQLENGNLQMSIRNFDTVIEVDRETGEIVDTVGRPGDHEVMQEQHAPNRLENWGTIVIADSDNNRIIEHDVETEEPVWTYGGQDLLHYPRSAERLPNGNTLIADSFNDRVIEIDEQGEIVWEYEGAPFVYSAERVAIENGQRVSEPGEGDETVPGWQLEGETADPGAVVGNLRLLEAWAAFVLPAWIALPELIALLVGTLAGVGLVVQSSIAWWGKYR
jgi:hypothetical protein